MGNYRCLTQNDYRTKKLFLSFPSYIYGDDCPQDYDTEEQLLNGTHVLSPDIEVRPFVVINRARVPICRCLLTYYKDDPVAYVGFFESVNNQFGVRELFRCVKMRASFDDKIKLVGPIDASIYIKYRFKINRFDKTYTGEPYNKKYYSELWEKCGFTVCDKYVSNQLRKVEKEDCDERLQRVYERYIKKGYTFVSPTKKTFKKHLNDVYFSIMKLYSNFSGYKRLSEEQFMTMFLPLKKILNFEMVRLAYKEDKLCAFCIALPNYGDLTLGKMTLKKFIKIMKIKKKPSEYIILYVGADGASAGLGGGLIQNVKDILLNNGCTSISALIKEGNVTGEMYKELYIDQFNYVLYDMNLTEE